MNLTKTLRVAPLLVVLLSGITNKVSAASPYEALLSFVNGDTPIIPYEPPVPAVDCSSFASLLNEAANAMRERIGIEEMTKWVCNGITTSLIYRQAILNPFEYFDTIYGANYSSCGAQHFMGAVEEAKSIGKPLFRRSFSRSYGRKLGQVTLNTKNCKQLMQDWEIEYVAHEIEGEREKSEDKKKALKETLYYKNTNETANATYGYNETATENTTDTYLLDYDDSEEDTDVDYNETAVENSTDIDYNETAAENTTDVYYEKKTALIENATANASNTTSFDVENATKTITVHANDTITKHVSYNNGTNATKHVNVSDVRAGIKHHYNSYFGGYHHRNSYSYLRNSGRHRRRQLGEGCFFCLGANIAVTAMAALIFERGHSSDEDIIDTLNACIAGTNGICT